MIATKEIGRTATVTLGTLVLSTAALAFATAPARASVAAPVAAWQAQVDRQIDRAAAGSTVAAPGDIMQAVTVAVRFDAAGRFADATVAKSSGSPVLDAEALRTARSVSYPPLPAGAAGRTVTMQLFFGPDADLAANGLRQQRLARR